MRRLTEHFERHVHNLPDPLQRAQRAVFEYLTFFQQHPQYVELLIQERAEFRDRQKPTYFVHRDAHVERWRDLFRGLIAAGRVRDVPVDRICDVLSDLVYGTMFTNYFAARRNPVEAQARDILDIVFHGVLSEAERGRQASGAGTKRPPRARRRKS
jgi:AcrR family transcriptional regulator